MDLITYQKLSAKTEKPMGPAARLRHARLGVLTELGEFASTAKKILVYGKPRNDPTLVKNMHEELGDFCFYAVIPFNVFDCEAEYLQMAKGGHTGARMDLDTSIGCLLDMAARLWRAVDHHDTEPAEAQRDILMICAHMFGVIYYHVAPELGFVFEDLLDANVAKLQGSQGRYKDGAYSDAQALARADKGGLDSKES